MSINNTKTLKHSSTIYKQYKFSFASCYVSTILQLFYVRFFIALSEKEAYQKIHYKCLLFHFKITVFMDYVAVLLHGRLMRQLLYRTLCVSEWEREVWIDVCDRRLWERSEYVCGRSVWEKGDDRQCADIYGWCTCFEYQRKFSTWPIKFFIVKNVFVINHVLPLYYTLYWISIAFDFVGSQNQDKSKTIV